MGWLAGSIYWGGACYWIYGVMHSYAGLSAPGAGAIFAPGVYRKDPVPAATLPMWHVLDPMGRGSAGATIVDMAFLLAE